MKIADLVKIEDPYAKIIIAPGHPRILKVGKRGFCKVYHEFDWLLIGAGCEVEANSGWIKVSLGDESKGVSMVVQSASIGDGRAATKQARHIFDLLHECFERAKGEGEVRL